MADEPDNRAQRQHNQAQDQHGGIGRQQAAGQVAQDLASDEAHDARQDRHNQQRQGTPGSGQRGLSGAQHQGGPHSAGGEGGQQAKHDRDGEAQHQPHTQCFRVDGEPHSLRYKALGERPEPKHQAQTQGDAQNAAHNAQDQGLNHEHERDLASLHADGLEHSNL